MDTRPHILCIDDDRETVELVAEELADRGFRVSVAFDGEEGYRSMVENEPDLALVDVTMPALSGFGLLERITAMAPRFSHMPFLYLSALSDRDSELHGRQLGADDYITKPIDFDILVSIIQARLNRVARNGLWPRMIDLSDREAETLTWAARGKTSSEIATILGLTKRTVDFHIDNARIKLDATSRMHAVVKAAAGQLIKP